MHDVPSGHRRSLRIAVALLATVLAARTLPAAEAQRKPNIVVILADDLGYADLGIQGSTEIATPHIDSIASNGVRFLSGYVSGPVCSPTRAALLSGKYQQRHGDEHLTGNPDNKDGLSLAVQTLPQRLKEAGYVTGIFGKWHLGEGEAHHPLSRGFDEFYGFLCGGRSYFPMEEKAIAASKANPTKGDPRMWRNREVVADPDYTTDAFADEAIAFMKRSQASPFLVYLSFNAVHTPNQTSLKHLDRFSGIADATRRAYLSRVAAMDDAVGRVLSALDELTLTGQTLVLFLSDNGGPVVRVSRNAASNTPLRGSKGETWEGGIRVPFFAQWPGTLPAGATFAPPVIQMDITATALALAGVEPPAGQLDGVDLMPFLSGAAQGVPHQELFWRFHRSRAIRQGDWKLVDSMINVAPDEGRPSGWMLFNVADDMEEQHDLGATHPDRVKKMQQCWQTWNDAVDREADRVKALTEKTRMAAEAADE
jgi:arylsulfatase A-like enzyme